jgi:sugar/nucleoside kinase (ribokinase family)
MSADAPITLCLGEALIDLIGEQPVSSMQEVERFVPHSGGVVANVAVVAARAGARVGLAGCAGDDQWGRWLRESLESEGVETSRFALSDAVQTQLAFVGIDSEGEPTYELYGEPQEIVVPEIDEAVRTSAALFFSSNTLPGRQERELTMRARELALNRTPPAPVIFDCNLRLRRWSSRADAAASANACVPGALLVRVSQSEAELMTGERDPERAAMALRKAGATMVVIGLGADGAILRGPVPADAGPAPAQVLSTVGAGDALTGTLLARLALSGFYPPAAAAGLGDAVTAAARACERWGALD